MKKKIIFMLSIICGMQSMFAMDLKTMIDQKRAHEENPYAELNAIKKDTPITYKTVPLVLVNKKIENGKTLQLTFEPKEQSSWFRKQQLLISARNDYIDINEKWQLKNTWLTNFLIGSGLAAAAGALYLKAYGLPEGSVTWEKPEQPVDVK